MYHRVGETHSTTYCGDVIIIGYTNARKVLVRFINTGYEGTYRMDKIRKGLVKDPLHRGVCGVGYLGVGEYKSTDSAYNTWSHMIHRCYSLRVSDKNKSYNGVEVCGEWHNYQAFAIWFYTHTKQGYQIDKDLLKSGNKLYCPELCCMLPYEINASLINKKGYPTNYPVGVSYHKRDEVFTVAMSVGGKLTHLGTFPDEDTASQVYKTAKSSLLKGFASKYPDLPNKVLAALNSYNVIP